MKGATRLMLVVIGLLLIGGIVAAMWKASQAEGIVVDTFSVPPRFSQDGITGQVVADDLTSQISMIRIRANASSAARSKDVRQNGEEIKIEIPETGVSLGQAWRVLRTWLGHERRLGGNIRIVADGKIALTAVLDGAGAVTFSGAPGDLEKLEQQAAERIFQLEDPVNYVLYLGSVGRRAESLAAAAPNLQPSGTPAYRADALSLWANRTRTTGDPVLAIARARLAVAIDPHVSAPRGEIITSALMLSRDEEALQEARTLAERHDWFDPVWSDSNGVAAVVERGTITRDELSGDFARAISDACTFRRGCETFSPTLERAENAARVHDMGRARDSIHEAIVREASPAVPAFQEALARARYFTDAAVLDWPHAADDARAMVKAVAAGIPEIAAIRMKTQAAPLLAIALARSGDLAGAEATIGPTPLDCYGCLRARALIAASAKQPQRADDWFSRAVKAAPSIPFAYTEWGQDFLERGQPDPAIEKFRQANEKGPHFADPLEGWGEALMAKNQSHLALAKFAEAEKFAPNWGRLHLKWGEALAYSGKKEEAKAQFARAAQLEPTPSGTEKLRGTP
jgi:tetratricopeptide (TPR) repeat protein